MNSVVTKILDCCYHYSNNNNNNKMLFKPQSLSSDSDDMDDNESTTTATTNKLSSKSSYQHRNRCPQSLISSESLSLSSFTTNLPHLSSSNDDDIDRISQSSAYQSLSSSYRSAIDSNFSIKINNNVAHHDRTTITEHYSSIMLPYHYHYHHRHLLKNFHQRCLLILFLISILFDYSKFVHCDRNRFYHISALCLRERVHPLSKKIDGAVITSKAENNLDCTITFQTDTILQKFMLRFEKLALDCNDHLYIYDGAHTIGNHKADLSCRSTRTEVGTIYTQSNFLTLRYQTDAYSKADNGFRLIITAYKDSKNYCREHRCANQYCISRDLVCDGVNHCGDNSDEHYYVHCQENEINDTIIGLDPMLFIAIVSTIFILCLTLVIMVTFCLCRRERLLIQQRQQQQQMALQQQQQYQLHDTGHHLGTTPLMMHQQYHQQQQHQHYPNNSTYQTKLDGACTMITSLDYGTTTTTQTALAAFGASNAITGGMITRNGGLVNSYTHTALPNNNVNQNHFATLPHQHHNHQQQQVMLPGQQQGSPILQQQQQQQQHVRFGTLPNRSGSISNNNNLNNSPQHNGNLAGLMNTVVTTTNTGNGHVTTIPVSSANNNNNLQQLS